MDETVDKQHLLSTFVFTHLYLQIVIAFGQISLPRIVVSLSVHIESMYVQIRDENEN